jgi:hypothetical protein
MHAFLLGKQETMIIDHINGNSLDNRRDNLRFLTRSQNNQNRIKSKNKSSKYTGVSFEKNKWKVQYCNICLGYFDNEDLAGKQYDMYALLDTNGIAKTNNLINYLDIKNLDKNTLVFKKNRDTNLPKNIYNKHGKFIASIMYNKITYTSKLVNTINEAENQLKIIKINFKNIKDDDTITRNNDGFAIIKISNKECIIDDEKWHELSKIKWRIEKSGYIQTNINKIPILMHRYLLNPDKNSIVDHINNNRHDNRLCNLRIVSHAVNAHNKIKKNNCSSKYIGVSLNKKQKWIAYINYNSRQIQLGTFDKEIDAAIAYNNKAIELYKEYANLNKIEI